MAMTGFICHDDYYDRLSRLTDEEVGHLFRQLMLYHAGRTDEMTDFIGMEGLAFDFISADIDRLEEKHAEKSETNRINGSKGGRPKKQTEPTETKRNQTKATDERFERFWAAYPRKVGKGKAQESFKKIKPSEELTKRMLDAVNAQMKSAQWQEEGGRYIPNPATWLNQSRWEDEPGKAFNPGIKSEAAQRYEQRPVEDEDELPSWYGE